MPKAVFDLKNIENRGCIQLMQKIFLTTIAFLSIISAIVPTVTMVTYGSKDPQNQSCYNSGFADGKQNHIYNQSMSSQCDINDRAYYEGFLSGCISGHGKYYFSCQESTNASIGGGGNSNN